MRTASEIQEQINVKLDELNAIQTVAADQNRELDTNEQKRIDELAGSDGKSGEIKNLKTSFDRALAVEQLQKEMTSQRMGSEAAASVRKTNSTALVPAQAKRHGNLIAFANDHEGQKEAYTVGKWFAAKFLGHKDSERWLKERGLYAQQEGTIGKGLELVPEPLEAAILKRLQMISNWTSKVRTSVMTSQTLKIPDRLTGVTVYYPDENAAITASNMTLAQQLLTARKMACLTQVSSEITEDSVISVMDMLADDIAHQFSKKLEEDAFLGDGTATYGGVTGMAGSIGANSTVTGAGTASSDFTMANYEAVIALNPWFQGSTPEWYCSSSVYANSMLPLLSAAGGTPGSEIVTGWTRSFLGFPVNIVQSMDNGSTVSTDQVYFGDLSQSVYYGVRRGMSIATSSDYGFNTDSIYIRGTMRNAITIDNHDTSAAGPVIALETAAT